VNYTIYLKNCITLYKVGVSIFTQLSKTKIMFSDKPAVVSNAIVADINSESEYPKQYKDIPQPFSCLIAREVRHPLTIIELSVELLESSEDDTVKKECLSLIKKSNLRVNSLMELLFNHEANQEKQFFLSVNKLLDDVLETNADTISQNEISVRRHYDANDVEILLDEAEIKVALSNIIINAIDAMVGKKGELKLVTQCGVKKYIVEIRDNGCGISKNYLPNIFTPHYTAKDGRLGMGLASAYDILTSNNVEVSVESEEGKGTNFIFSFIKT
jgi:signal transduction histidine kinase